LQRFDSKHRHSICDLIWKFCHSIWKTVKFAWNHKDSHLLQLHRSLWYVRDSDGDRALCYATWGYSDDRSNTWSLSRSVQPLQNAEYTVGLGYMVYGLYCSVNITTRLLLRALHFVFCSNQLLFTIGL